MGGVIKKVNNIFIRFIGQILGFESGGFEIGHGKHEITIPLDICTPRSVWTQVISYGNEGCGQFPVNKVGCLLSEHQIIFVCDIETETAKIEWFAVE